VDEPDASAAGAGVAQGAARLCWEVADAARVLVVAFRFAGQERGDRRVGHGEPAVPFVPHSLPHGQDREPASRGPSAC